MLDLLIKNGRVLTASRRLLCDVAVQAWKIVGWQVHEAATRTINAEVASWPRVY